MHLPTPLPHLPTFLPTLIISSSSFLLSSGIAALTTVWLAEGGGPVTDEYSEAGGITRACAGLVLQWALLSAGVSATGVVGTVLHRSTLIRLFSIGAALDLLCTIFLLLILLISTFSPTLSNPFGTYICGALTSGELLRLTSALREREGRAGTSGVGIELVAWGVNVCEEKWREGMVVVLVGCAIAVAVRVWGTMVAWEHFEGVRRRLEGEAAWWEVEEGIVLKEIGGEETGREEEEMLLRAAVGRVSLERQRANSAPHHHQHGATTPPDSPPRYTSHGRFKSHSLATPPRRSSSSSSSSQRPRLVLVPVFLDSSSSLSASNGNITPPSYSSHISTSPTSYFPHQHHSSSTPSRTSPPRSRESSASRRSRSTSHSSSLDPTTTSPRLGYTPTFADSPTSFEAPAPRYQRTRSFTDGDTSSSSIVVNGLGLDIMSPGSSTVEEEGRKRA